LQGDQGVLVHEDEIGARADTFGSPAATPRGKGHLALYAAAAVAVWAALLAGVMYLTGKSRRRRSERTAARRGHLAV
jgi:hypothetical protein